MTDRPVFLIGCSAAKAAAPMAARDFYRGDLFRKAVDFAEPWGPWFVLSAAHGLVAPDRVLAPYDLALSRLGAAGAGVWADGVVDQLVQRRLTKRRLVLLAGRTYRDPLAARLAGRVAGVRIEVPLEGLGIGEQKAALARWRLQNSGVAPC